MSTSQTALLLALVLIAAIAVVINQQEYVPGDSQPRDGGHDAFMEEIELSIMDDTGQAVVHLTAAAMQHFPDTDSLVLHDPEVNVSRPDGSTWIITAARGETTDDGGRVWLPGDVLLRRTGTDGVENLQINASDMLVHPHQKLAETDARAVIHGDRFQAETTGLDADFNTNRLELRQRVRGTYDVAG